MCVCNFTFLNFDPSEGCYLGETWRQFSQYYLYLLKIFHILLHFIFLYTKASNARTENNKKYGKHICKVYKYDEEDNIIWSNIWEG